MTAPHKPTITVEEIARDLDVSTMTVYRLIRDKELRAFRVGRMYRVRRQDYMAYLRSIDTMQSAS